MYITCIIPMFGTRTKITVYKDNEILDQAYANVDSDELSAHICYYANLYGVNDIALFGCKQFCEKYKNDIYEYANRNFALNLLNVTIKEN